MNELTIDDIVEAIRDTKPIHNSFKNRWGRRKLENLLIIELI